MLAPSTHPSCAEQLQVKSLDGAVTGDRRRRMQEMRVGATLT